MTDRNKPSHIVRVGSNVADALRTIIWDPHMPISQVGIRLRQYFCKEPK
jgi:hypothetical protein